MEKNDSIKPTDKMGLREKELSTEVPNYNLISPSSDSKMEHVKPQTKQKSQFSFESSLILMHKFFKEQKIYTDPNDHYKRRTVVLIRSNPYNRSFSSTSLKSKHNLSDSSLFKSATSSSNSTSNPNGEFGFNLQTYGLLNSITKETEYICFVNNVQPKSPAKKAGLNNGDVLLAIDGIQIDQFKSFSDIAKHVKNKNELRLVIIAENVCKKIQYQQRIEQIKKLLADKKLELDQILKKEEEILKKYNISNLNIPSPVLDLNKKAFSTPINNNNLLTNRNINNNNNIMSISTTSSNSNYDHLITSPNSNLNLTSSNFLSPNISSSGIVTESSTSSTNTSASVSNSSSFSSSSLTNSSLTNSKNMIIIKNSTPNEPKYTQNKSSFLSPDINNTSDLNDSSFNSNSAFVRSSTGSTFIKLIKPNDTSSISNDSNKSKSLAKKYLEQTSRMVRSASSSSLNLLSKLSSNQNDQKSISRKNLNRHSIAESNNNNNEIKLEKKFNLKDATTTSSSTDDSFSYIISSNKPIQHSESFHNNNNNNNNNNFKRVVKLNNNYNDSLVSSKKKSLFNKLNNSVNLFDSSFNKSKEILDSKNETPANSSIRKNSIFSLLTNKPKVTSNNKNDPKKELNTQKGEFVSIKSNHLSSNIFEYVTLRSKSKSSPSNYINTGIGSAKNLNISNQSEAGVARIKSNGGIDYYDDESFLNHTASFMEDSYLNSSAAVQIDYSNEDYVITRL